MKQNLNEQLSRIKGMIKMVNENEFDSSQGSVEMSELGGYIGNAPEKIDGPFMKEIDPSVYEDVSYLEAMKADILLMRLFRSDIISKDSYNEVKKPINAIINTLKGEYWDKQKDLPF